MHGTSSISHWVDTGLVVSGVEATNSLLDGVFWGLFLYSTVLPTAILAWQMAPEDASPPEVG